MTGVKRYKLKTSADFYWKAQLFSYECISLGLTKSPLDYKEPLTAVLRS